MLPRVKLLDVGSIGSSFESLSESPPHAPSRDGIHRLLLALKPEAFQRCFQAWICAAIPPDAETPRRLVAIDGKSCRGSHDDAKSLGILHIVSAWASEQGIAQGPVATAAKSNAITAIPQLLEQIDLTVTLITIDAMGRQKDIVEPIVTGGGDCVIAVKDNQPKCAAAIQGFFLDHLERDLEDLRYRCHETREDGHGRIDERSYFLAKVPQDFALGKEWPWIKAIGDAVRVTPHADGTESDEVRDYLSSRSLRCQWFGVAVRGHGGIESMHWVLDVNFREDEHRTRERTLGKNLSWLRRFAVTLLKRHPDKDRLRGKMMSSMINTDYLSQVLSLQRV